MANDTVLQIVRDACNEIGITAPNTATGSSDLQIIQLTALVNREGRELAARYGWTELTREITWTTIAAEDQGALVGGIIAVGEGFKYILNETIWDRSTQYPLTGPTSPARWQAEKAFTTVGPYARYRIRDNHLRMLPAPAAGLTLAFEIVTDFWVSDVMSATRRNRFTADDDYPLLDSNLITLGAIWRWKKTKGLEYAEDFQTYELAVADATSRNSTKPVVSFNGPTEMNYQPYVVVPLSNWPL